MENLYNNFWTKRNKQLIFVLFLLICLILAIDFFLDIWYLFILAILIIFIISSIALTNIFFYHKKYSRWKRVIIFILIFTVIVIFAIGLLYLYIILTPLRALLYD